MTTDIHEDVDIVPSLLLWFSLPSGPSCEA